MNKLRISARLHLFVIISCALVAIGLAVGLICHFVAGGYFNYGNDYKSYKTVTVSYVVTEYDREEVHKISSEAFDAAGVNYYGFTANGSRLGEDVVYKFSKSVSDESLQTAAAAITDKFIAGGSLNSRADFHTEQTVLGGGKALIFASIALSAAVVFQFLYFLVRYKLSAALAAFTVDLHNLALFLTLCTLTRVPVGSSVIAFAALTVLVTMVGCAFLFDKIRKKNKEEGFAALPIKEQADICARETLVTSSVLSAAVAVCAVLVFVLLSISALSVVSVLSYAVGAVLMSAVCVYGVSFFTPALYARFREIKVASKQKSARNADK